MKFLIVFALALATVSAKNLYFRSIEIPVLENEGRINNGQDASPGQFKYQVGLMLADNRLVTQWCGGSLIGKNWILSAARCTFGASSGKAFLGATQRLAAETVHNITKGDIITHPIFNPTTHENDISLIRIPTTSESSRIGIVRIPSYDDKHVGDSAVVSGWGVINKTDNAPTNDLKYVIVKVSPDSLCSQLYGSDFIDRTSICADTLKTGSPCRGDAGSPLVLTEKNLQIGLASNGLKYCYYGLPVVFTRVGIYGVWIKSNTGITGISKL